SPKRATPTLSSSRLSATPVTSAPRSSISPATQFSCPYTRAMPSPISSTVPTSARSVSTSASAIRCFRIDVISSGRSFKTFSLAVDQFFTELVEPAAHTRVGPHGAGLDDDAADDVGVDRPRGDDAPARGLLDLLDDLGGLLVRELDGGRQLELEDALLACQQPSEFLVHLLDLGDPSLLGEQVDEIQEDLVPARQQV